MRDDNERGVGMPQLYIYGDRALCEESLIASTDSELRALAKDTPPIVRATSFAQVESFRGSSTEDGGTDGAQTPSPIGIGRPLSIEIGYVYTGMLTARGRPDMMIASSVKRLPIYDAAPRAVQALLEDLPKQHGFASLPANLPGTPLVYHTPSLTDRGITVTVEMVFDRFPAEAFDQVGNMLANAAGIPVFAPATAYLTAGSVIVKLISKIAEKVIDGSASFSENLNINVDRPLYEDTSPGMILLTPSHQLASMVEKETLKADLEHGLLTAGGHPYDGQDPYMILTLDGSDRPDYKDFAPTMASAALLDRFLHTGENRPTPTGLVLEALQAYNDIHYRGRADAIKKRLDALPDQSSEEAVRLKKLLDAYIKNIDNDLLKPASNGS